MSLILNVGTIIRSSVTLISVFYVTDDWSSRDRRIFESIRIIELV